MTRRQWIGLQIARAVRQLFRRDEGVTYRTERGTIRISPGAVARHERRGRR